MMALKATLTGLKDFFTRRIWETDLARLAPGRRLQFKTLQVATAVTREFVADNCLQQASALAFTTVLSIVPFLAIMFALLKGLGAQTDLEILILNHLALGSEEIVDSIFTYIANTNLAKLGIFGVISLLITVSSLLYSIEDSFNRIWRVSETRSVVRLFSDYMAIIIFAPILVLVAISMTTTLESQSFVKHLISLEPVGETLVLLFKIIPYLAMWAVFAALYLYMPNTRISVGAALTGAAVGATLWQLVQWGYVTFQFGVSRYNAIYGTMAALPIFMIWIYLSWAIVLLGLEITFALQNLRSIREEFRSRRISSECAESAALAIILCIGQTFRNNQPALSAEEIALQLHLPPRLTRESLQLLQRLGFVAEIAGRRGQTDRYQPGQDLDRLKVKDFVDALRRDGDPLRLQRMGGAGRIVSSLRQRIDAALGSALDDLTVRDLVDELDVRGGAEEAAP